MNLIYAVPPYLTPGIAAYTSDQPQFPVTNLLKDQFPARPHRSLGITQQDITLDGFATMTPNGLFLNRTNYQEIKLFRASTLGGTYDECTPNVLLKNRTIRVTASNGAPESPWSIGSGSPTITPGAAAGPFRNQQAQQVNFTASGDIIQQSLGLQTSGANRPVSASVWLRTFSGTTSLSLRAACGPSAASFVESLVTVGPQWDRFTFQGTLPSSGAGATWTFQLRNNSGAATSFLFGGAQMTCDGTMPLKFDYETGANGLVIPIDPRTGRRRCYLDMTGFSARYLRLRIPAQTPTDGAGYFSTGALTLVNNATLLPGLHQFPLTVNVRTPQARTDFESEAFEIISLGDPRTVLGFRGQFVAGDVEDFFLQMARMRAGTPVLIVENTWLGGSRKDATDPSRAALYRITSQGQFSYTIPELFETEWTLEELV